MSDKKNPNFAIIRLNSKQYIVEEGSKLKVDRVSEGTSVEVLLAGIDGNIEVGTPLLSNIALNLEVIAEAKDDKVEVRRYKSKSRYRKHKGHRQPISIINVLGIGSGKESKLTWNIKAKEEKPVKVAEVKAEESKAEKPAKSPKAKAPKATKTSQ